MKPSGMGEVTLVINPDRDPQFRAVVDDLTTRQLQTPSQLQQELRKHYPDATVFDGVPDAAGGKRWYVYRDGHWVAPLQ